MSKDSRAGSLSLSFQDLVASLSWQRDTQALMSTSGAKTGRWKMGIIRQITKPLRTLGRWVKLLLLDRLWDVARTYYQPISYLFGCKNVYYVVDLPEECLVCILAFLSHDDLITCRSVCKQWELVTDSYPELWSSAHIRLIRLSDKGSDLIAYYKQLQRSGAYVEYLINRRARIRTLNVNMSTINKANFNLIALLLTSGCCQQLHSFTFKWFVDWTTGDCPSFDTSFVLYLSILKLLETFCRLKSLKTQFNWTLDSVDYISSFKSLRRLEIFCLPKVHSIQKWHIDKVLNELPNLEALKLQVTIIPKNVQRFTLISKSIKRLDLSNSANLIISEMKLPSLQEFLATNVRYSKQDVSLALFLQDVACLFEVIHLGCGNIKMINNVPVRPENGLGLDDNAKSGLRICFCPLHST